MKHFLQRITPLVLGGGFMVGLFSSLVVEERRALLHAEEELKTSLSVVVFLQSVLSEEQSRAWGDLLKQNEPALLRFQYTSKVQAYEETMHDPLMAKSLQLLKENPFPASYRIQLKDQAWLDRTDPVEKIKTLPNIQELRWSPETRQIYLAVNQWRSRLEKGMAVLAGFLGVWLFCGFFGFFRSRRPLRDISLYGAWGILGSGAGAGTWFWIMGPASGRGTPWNASGGSWIPLIAGVLWAWGHLVLTPDHG